ncbi:MAG TPA: LuxR C-terminal-related transcriptional regulator [Actinocrinis sp.]
MIFHDDFSLPARDAADRFAGRRPQLRQIADLAVAALSGRPQTVLIEGLPGMGKSTLLRRSLRDLTQFEVLKARGSQDDATRPFGVTGQLLHAADASRRNGLRTAVQRRLDGGAAVIVSVDDLALADGESASELLALMRVRPPAALLILFAARSPWRPAPGGDGRIERLRQALLAEGGAARIALPELTSAEAADLLGSGPAGGGERPAVPEQLARSLHEYTGGHPALLSVLLEQDLSEARSSPGDLLGLSHPLVTRILQTVATLPPGARDLLDALAVLDSCCPLSSASTVARVEDPWVALETLLEAELVDWFPDEPVTPVQIRYPLYRDVVYRGLPVARREALHTRAAEYAIGTRAWAHRVAASGHDDLALADELGREAERYHRAGDNERAGALLLWSVDASPDPAERERSLIRAARWAYSLRAVDWGPQFQAKLARRAPSAARNLILGLIAEAEGLYPQARALLVEARRLARADQSADVLLPEIDLALALVHADLGDTDAQYQLARDLLAADSLSAVSRAWAEYHVADAWGRMNGGPAAALNRLAAGAAASAEPAGSPDAADGPDYTDPPGDDDSPGRSVLLWARGTWRILSGQLRRGNDDLARLLRSADRGTMDVFSPLARVYIGYAEYLLGDWASAENAVAQALTALEGNAVLRMRVPAHAVAACISAGKGQWEPAAQHVQAARHWHAQCGPVGYAAFPALAAATLAQARADYGKMLTALQPLVAAPRRSSEYQAWWLPLYVESLLGTGQLGAAQHALAQLRELAEAGACSAVCVAWLDAWLTAGGRDEFRARARYEEATSRPPAPDDMPLQRARLDHDYGRHLAATRHRKAAIGWLRRAHEQYTALGAKPFAERCAHDLEQCGASVAPAGGGLPGGQALLSAQERRIAFLVAQGLTNQQVANEMFVSAKTVEYHLGNVFAKLGITSRRQLRSRLGGESEF